VWVAAAVALTVIAAGTVSVYRSATQRKAALAAAEEKRRLDEMLARIQAESAAAERASDAELARIRAANAEAAQREEALSAALSEHLSRDAAAETAAEMRAEMAAEEAAREAELARSRGYEEARAQGALDAERAERRRLLEMRAVSAQEEQARAAEADAAWSRRRLRDPRQSRDDGRYVSTVGESRPSNDGPPRSQGLGPSRSPTSEQAQGGADKGATTASPSGH
jgi:hypothetical protein